MGDTAGRLAGNAERYRLIFQPRGLECRVQVNVDLAKRAVAEIDEFVGLARFDNQDVSCFGFALFRADRPTGTTLDDVNDLVVVVLVKPGTVAGIAHHQEERNPGAGMIGADEIVGHAVERKLRLVDRVHTRFGFTKIPADSGSMRGECGEAFSDHILRIFGETEGWQFLAREPSNFGGVAGGAEFAADRAA